MIDVGCRAMPDKCMFTLHQSQGSRSVVIQTLLIVTMYAERQMAYKDRMSLQALTAHPRRSSSQPQAGSCREEEVRRMDVVDAYEMSHDEFDEKLEKEWFLFEVREEVMRKFFQRVYRLRGQKKKKALALKKKVILKILQ